MAEELHIVQNNKIMDLFKKNHIYPYGSNMKIIANERRCLVGADLL